MSRWGWGGAAAAAAVVAGAGWYWLGAEPVPAGSAAVASAASSSHLALPAPPPVPAASLVDAAVPAPAASRAEPANDGAPGIGSEGYGPHVQRALDSGDPRRALEAARWIAKCRPDMDVESMINGSHPKYRLVLPAAVRAEVITQERQNQRYCQTLTPDLMAQHQALAIRALEAQVPGAGLAYYDSLNRESRAPAELARALQGLRTDLEHGEEMAVPLLALQDLGQSRVERLAASKLMDLMVLKSLLPPTTGLVPPDPPDPPYTPKEQAEAAALVTRWWARFKPPG